MSSLPVFHAVRSRGRALLGLLVVLALSGAGCGGGTEVAPSDPAPQGSGAATASLAGVDLGATQLVTATVGGAVGVRRSTTDEAVVVGSDMNAAVANAAMEPNPPAVVTDASGATTYTDAGDVASCDAGLGDYFITFTSGLIRICPGSSITAGQTLLVDYSYTASLPSLLVGVTFAQGSHVDLEVHDLEADETGPLTVNAVSLDPPSDNSVAFHVTVKTNQTQPANQQVTYVTDSTCSTPGAPGCPVVNELHLESVNLANRLNPCASGSATVAVYVEADPSSPREVFTFDFDDPSC